MPRTIRNEFDKYLTYEKLEEAHKLSQKGKTTKKEVILFNLKKEEYLNWLYEQLKSGEYKHGGYRVFYVTVPKRRKVQVSRYIDRIVHRWLVDNFLKEYFMKDFIYHSYACIKSKGMHNAVLNLQKAMKHCKRAWGEYYILKMDVAKFFQNIDRKILVEILKRKVKDKKLLDLLDKIIYSSEGEKGLPIGNYTSQTFANIYLNEVDKFVKEELKCRYYFRYMDDSVILLKNKQEAITVLNEIKKFLETNLELFLNSKTQIIKSRQGVNFCGYKVNENRLKIRDRGKRNLKSKIQKLEKMIEAGEISSKEAYKYITGHIGYINVANVKTLTNKLFYCGEL
jgi:retron-type reverse transcriptase